MDEKQMLIF